MKRYGIAKTKILWLLQQKIVTLQVDENGSTVVSKGGKELAQRINTRRRMNDGDARVDICFDKKKLSINVSHLVWMFYTNCVIPEGWEIHHRNEDPTDNSFNNLICVHPIDHRKLHAVKDEEEVPF